MTGDNSTGNSVSAEEGYRIMQILDQLERSLKMQARLKEQMMDCLAVIDLDINHAIEDLRALAEPKKR